MLIRALALLPLSLLRAMGRALAHLLWLLNIEARKVTVENLRLCFPELSVAERDVLARRSVEHLCVTIFEMSAVWCRSGATLGRWIGTVDGKALLDEAIARGCGVILLGPHFGNWEVMGMYLDDQGPVTYLYQPIRWPALDNLVRKARISGGAKVAPTDASGVKTLLKNLKKGEMIGVLPDQTPPLENGEFAPFFGVPALTMTLVSNLYQRTTASVLVCAALRNDATGMFDIVFEAADPALFADDLPTSVAGLNRSVEHLVRRCPEQYQWEYKRFRRQPGGERPYYRK